MSFVSTIKGLFGYQKPFIVTTKGKGIEKPYTLFELLPQLSCCIFCIASVTWGYLRWMNHEDMTLVAFFVNALWMALFFFSIFPVFFYNTALQEDKDCI